MGKRGTTLSSNYINWRRLLRSVRNNKRLFMDTEIKILYGAFFVIIFLGLLFSLAKGWGDSKNFLNLKEKITMIQFELQLITIKLERRGSLAVGTRDRKKR